MNKTLVLALIIASSYLFGAGCKPKSVLPDEKIAAKQIQEKIIENGQMPGGNAIDIHQFELTKIESGNTPSEAIIEFKIDFTRYPTSGLAPEYQTENPQRQTEAHQAVLEKQNGKWSVQQLSLQ